MPANELRDAVHGDIELYDYEMSIIDTPHFQRLRRIKQLPLVDLVYTNATHNRFSHSVGVMELADRIARNLDPPVPEAERRLIRVAALLHDIEEPPFYNVMGFMHDRKEIQATLVRDVCKNLREASLPSTINPEKIITLLQNPQSGYGHQIIFSPLGANKLDFLLRDSFFCGVKYGNIDLRILSEFEKDEDNQLLLKDEAISIAETIFYALYQMKLSVYDHKIVRAATALVKKAVQDFNLTSTQLVGMDDNDFLSLLDSGTQNCLKNRNLPKMAYHLDSYVLFSFLGNVNLVRMIEQKMEDEKIIKGLETELSSSLGIDPESIFIDFMSRREFGDLWKPQLEVRIANSTKPLENASRALSVWYDYFIEQWRMFIFSKAGDREIIKKKCETIFSFFETKDERNVPSYLVEILQIAKETGIAEKRRREIMNKILELKHSQCEALLSLLELQYATISDIKDKINKKRTTTNILLNDLADDGLIRKERHGRTMVYNLQTDVAEILKKIYLEE